MCPRSTRTHHFSKAVALLVAGRVLVLRQIANARIEHYKRLSEFRAYDRQSGSNAKMGSVRIGDHTRIWPNGRASLAP